jgi:hypothetical protein
MFGCYYRCSLFCTNDSTSLLLLLVIQCLYSTGMFVHGPVGWHSLLITRFSLAGSLQVCAGLKPRGRKKASSLDRNVFASWRSSIMCRMETKRQKEGGMAMEAKIIQKGPHSSGAFEAKEDEKLQKLLMFFGLEFPSNYAMTEPPHHKTRCATIKRTSHLNHC